MVTNGPVCGPLSKPYSVMRTVNRRGLLTAGGVSSEPGTPSETGTAAVRVYSFNRIALLRVPTDAIRAYAVNRFVLVRSEPSLIVGQTEADYDGAGGFGHGSFTGGNSEDYQNNPTLTMSNGATVRVDLLTGPGGGRVVDEFTIITAGPAEVGVTYAETTFGSGFSITPGTSNIE